VGCLGLQKLSVRFWLWLSWSVGLAVCVALGRLTAGLGWVGFVVNGQISVFQYDEMEVARISPLLAGLPVDKTD
jgi:hypothetical protein